MSNNTNPTQCERILAYLKTHEKITQFEAIAELGILRLASRIHDLKTMGKVVVSQRETVYNRFGEPCTVSAYSIQG